MKLYMAAYSRKESDKNIQFMRYCQNITML